MDKNIPNDVDLEKRVLAAMMMKDGKVVPTVTEILTADDFFRPQHRIIFKAILDVYNQGNPFNYVHVIEELKRKGIFDKHIIEFGYISALLQQEVTTAYAQGHAETIKEYSTKRRVIELCDAVKEKAGRIDITVDQIMADVEEFLVKSTDEHERSSFDLACDLALAAYERADKLSKTEGLTGVTTGLWDLNKVTNGLQKGELILLAARPSMGKTALALNIAQKAARAKKVVAVFSLEMSKAQIGIRILSATSGVEATKISSGKNISEREQSYLLTAIEDLEKCSLYIDDTSGLSVATMRMKLRQLKQAHGLDLIVVDYLQLMRGNGENRVQEISEISRGLKSLAKEFDVPVLALSQLSRQVEMRAEKRPQLSDLRDSGSLEQDADIVMFLYREEYYNRDEEENANLAELIIAKNRNGATGSVTLFFKKEIMLFCDFEAPTKKETA